MNVATEPSPIGHESALRLGFHHGLGDCVHYAHVLELYRRRGHRVLLSVESNKTGLWSLLGVPHVVDRSFGNPRAAPQSSAVNSHLPHGLQLICKAMVQRNWVPAASE